MKTFYIYLCLVSLLASSFSLKADNLFIVAKINNDIITNEDLESRLDLALTLSNLPKEDKIKQQLRKQVLNILIDETIKIQEAQRLGITLSSQDLSNQVIDLENRMNMERNTLFKKFSEINIPEETIVKQIKSQVLWQRLIVARVANNIRITEKQIEETFMSLVKSSGEMEYLFSEIFISSNSLNATSAKEKIESIYSQTTKNNFLMLAEQLSDSAVTNSNNQRNWIRENMLNEDLKILFSKMDEDEISKPVVSDEGYHIYFLNQKRKTKKISEDNTYYDLNQIFFKISDENLNEITDYYSNLINTLRENLKGCADLDNTIKQLEDGSGGRIGILKEEDIDPKFIPALKNLPVGKLSKIFVTKNGIQSLMLCSPIQKDSFAAIKKSIENDLKMKRINNAGILLLNKIKQRALIEIVNL